MTWREHLSEKNSVIVFVVTLVALVLTLVAYSRFIVVIEQRQGVVFFDPILYAIPPVDLTIMIFAMLYATIIATLIILWRDPPRLMRALRAYTVLVGIRVACMALLPLDPPTGMIALADPVVTWISGSASSPTRDLFFSGHTSLFCIITFMMPSKKLRWIFASLTVLLAIFLLAQHVHYSIDVVVAPLAAWTAYSLVSARTN